MKKLIIGILLSQSFINYAQSDSGFTLNPGQTMSINIGIKTTVDSIGSSPHFIMVSSGYAFQGHLCQNIYRDTTEEQIKLNYLYSCHNTNYDKDTEFIYNHWMFLLQKIEREEEYWMKKIENYKDNGSIKRLLDLIEYRKKYEYFSGMEDIMRNMIYGQEINFNFKVK